MPDAKLLADRLQVRERDVLEMDQRLGSWELSLDQPIGKDKDDGTFLDLLPAPAPRIDEAVAEKELKLLFRKKLGGVFKNHRGARRGYPAEPAAFGNAVDAGGNRSEICD